MFIVAQAATAPNPWAEYGLIGLVIMSLFVVLGLLIRWAIAHIDRVHAAHRDERDLWRISTENSTNKMVASIDKLTDRMQGRS